MNWEYIITALVFFFLFYNNYIGSVGRIEGINQKTGMPQNLGPVTDKERIAFLEGKHKILAFKQALIGATIISLIVFLILSLIF